MRSASAVAFQAPGHGPGWRKGRSGRLCLLSCATLARRANHCRGCEAQRGGGKRDEAKKDEHETRDGGRRKTRWLEGRIVEKAWVGRKTTGRD